MVSLEGNMTGAQEPESVSTLPQRIAERAKRSPELGFTSLAHLMDLSWMYKAFALTRKDGAVGVDGQTAEDYVGDNLEPRLVDLLDRAKSGTYRAPPVRRVHIPKGTGPETRPLGIPTFEDKVLQRAVVMVLETVYEQDFSGLLLRLPAGAVGTSSVRCRLASGDGNGGMLDRGSGHPEIFRYSGSRSAAGASQATSTGRGAAPTDW